MATAQKSRHPGIEERRDGSGRIRYRVRVRRAGALQTATLATLNEALAWQGCALAAADGLQERPERPVKQALAVEPPGRAVTVEDACRRLARGIRDGSIRSRGGSPFKPSTVRKYEEQLRLLVIPKVGAVPTATLRRGDCQRLVDELAAEHTPEHARKALTALRVALRVAEIYGEVEANPCSGVRVPTDANGESLPHILTPEECRRITAAAYADDKRLKRSFAGPLVALLIGTGLRLGEALALPWGQDGLDLDSGVVRVRRSLDRVRDEQGRYPLVPPKFGRFRDVAIAPEDVTRLRRHRLACGRPEDGALVFSGNDGEALSPVPAYRGFKRACRVAYGLPKAKASELPRVHDTRHAFATHGLYAGLSPHAVAKLLGHADASLVWKRYGHALPDELAGAGVTLSEYRRRRRRDQDRTTTAKGVEKRLQIVG